MTLTFDFDGVTPLYKQLYDHIASDIKTGDLKVGEKLPSKRMLSQYLKISQNTVETAYQQLSAEGYIRSVPKSGFYVCNIEAFPSLSQMIKKSSTAKNETIPIKKYLYDFTTNTVDTKFFPFATWAKISREIMHDENRDLLKPTHPQGDYLLRESIAGYLHDYRGVNCLPEQIIIGAGTEYLLGLVIQILGRESVYAVENPGYQTTYNILNINGRKTNLINLDNEGMEITELTATDSSVAYITPSHHFPLGIVMPVARRMQLLMWANKGDNRFIIEDDYDSEFRFNGRPIPALQGFDENEKVIYISTFSKSIAPSIRISYMVLPMGLLYKYQHEFAFYSSTVSRFEQHTLYKFIKDGHFERHLNRMRNIYRARKDKFVEEIKKMPIASRIDILGESAGLHLLLRVNSSLKEQDLISRAEKCGLKLYGLSGYYNKPAKYMPDNMVIAGYTNFSEEEIEEAVKLLNKAWSMDDKK